MFRSPVGFWNVGLVRRKNSGHLGPVPAVIQKDGEQTEQNASTCLISLKLKVTNLNPSVKMMNIAYAV